MTTLITGNKGFIGQNLLDKVSSYVGIDSIRHDTLIYDLKNIANIDTQFDKVYHLGALSGIKTCEHKPNLAHKLNVAMTTKYLAFAEEKNCPLVFTSSAAAEDPDSSYYAETKYLAEKACDIYDTASIVRLSNVYGPYSINKTSVVTSMFMSAFDCGLVPVYGDGKQKRDFVFVEDVCYGLTNTEPGCDMYISTGVNTRIIDLAEMISNLTGAGISLTEEHSTGIVEPKEHSWQVYDIDYTPLEEGLKKTYNYFVETLNAENALT